MLFRFRRRGAKSGKAAPRNSDDDILPQPVQDQQIIDKMVSIRTNITSHVLNFYHRDPVNIKAKALEDELDAIIVHSDPGGNAQLSQILCSPKYRRRGLRKFILQAILSRIKFCGDPKLTLLPQGIVSSMVAFSTARKSEGRDPS
jgi:hypothetical protein